MKWRWGWTMTASKKQQSYERGLLAEKLAAGYLRLKGYKILRTRYKTPVGEIDLVAAKGDALVMVEVKARNDTASALESIDMKSQQRIENATLHFLASFPEFSSYGVRFDVIAFGRGYSLTHLDNAWEARS